jgi:hypothetical protein
MSTDPKKEDIKSRHIVSGAHAARAYFQRLSYVFTPGLKGSCILERSRLSHQGFLMFALLFSIMVNLCSNSRGYSINGIVMWEYR